MYQRAMAIKWYSAFQKFHHYWSLTMTLFIVISGTLVGEVLPLCRDEVGVFCRPSRLVHEESRLSGLQHWWDMPGYWEKSWRPEQICYHSDSTEKLSTNARMKRFNNNKNNNSNNNNNLQKCRLCCPGWPQNKTGRMWKEG